MKLKRVPYYYTGVPDKPGGGLKVLNALRDEAINLLAFVAFPKGRRAQLDFVPMDEPAFKAAAKKTKIKLIGPKTAFLVQGDERTGAIADTITKLAGAGINITALQAVIAGAGRCGAILWVKPRDVNKAAKVLLQG